MILGFFNYTFLPASFKVVKFWQVFFSGVGEQNISKKQNLPSFFITLHPWCFRPYWSQQYAGRMSYMNTVYCLVRQNSLVDQWLENQTSVWKVMDPILVRASDYFLSSTLLTCWILHVHLCHSYLESNFKVWKCWKVCDFGGLNLKLDLGELIIIIILEVILAIASFIPFKHSIT